MVPHSWRRRIQQSTNILGDCCLRLRQEWGTMVAAVSHLGHDALTDIVGLLRVVITVGIRMVLYQAIGDTLLTSWQWASSSALEPSTWQPLHQIGHCAMSSWQQHHWGMMCGSGGIKIGGIGPGFLHDVTLRIDQSWWLPLSYGRHEAQLPAPMLPTISQHVSII